MLWGTAFIAIVTAVITSTFVARATRDYYAAQAQDDALRPASSWRQRFDELEQEARPARSDARARRRTDEPHARRARRSHNVALTTAEATTSLLTRKRPTSSAAATPSAP